jgi:hypothetical protein
LGWCHASSNEDGGDEKSPPSIVLAILYVLGSFASTAGLGLGLGYIALVHNIFAAQLDQVSHQLEQMLTLADGGEDVSYGSVSESAATPANNSETPLIGITSRTSTALTVDSVGRQYAEFRRRQDTLARVFH